MNASASGRAQSALRAWVCTGGADACEVGRAPARPVPGARTKNEEAAGDGGLTPPSGDECYGRVVLHAKAWASAAMVAATTIACGEKEPTDATTACSPLADPTMKVQYEAVTPDGHYVVVLGAAQPGSRVFYGTPDRMAERRITDTAAGCFVSIDFVVDGADYGAVFAYPSCNGNIRSKLVGDDHRVNQPLTVLVLGGSQSDPGARAPDLMFVCF